MKTAWQNADVTRRYLTETRRALPYGADQLELMVRLVAHFRPRPNLVLDLGSGDGSLACLLLAAHPEARAILIDHSRAMLAAAKNAMTEFAGRYEAVLGDLSASPLTYAGAGSVDVVVSGYAIHHLPDTRKQALYADVFDLLAPGGLFVNVEHVASPTPELEEFWEDLLIDQIAASSGRPRAAVGAEQRDRPDKADNILVPVETQVRWLRDLGFQHADCYFKFFGLAVFGGVKPAADAREKVADAVRRHLGPHQPEGFRLEVTADGVQQSGDWWYVAVQPTPPDIRARDYSDVMDQAEEDIKAQANLKALLLPVLPGD